MVSIRSNWPRYNHRGQLPTENPQSYFINYGSIGTNLQSNVLTFEGRMKNDSGIEWIRKVRHRISEECDHDPLKLVEYYMNWTLNISDSFS